MGMMACRMRAYEDALVWLCGYVVAWLSSRAQAAAAPNRKPLILGTSGSGCFWAFK